MQQEETYFFGIKQLTVGYQNISVVQDVNVSLAQGEILTLIGGNGAGKSTILKSIMGQLKPLTGVVCLEENSIHEMAAAKRAQDMAVVLTERVKGEYMTCEDVVSMGRYPYTGTLGILSPADKEKVRQTMELVGIAALADKDFSTLSDGQKQLTMLARALCQEPKLLILDEPMSGLDPMGRRDVREAIMELNRTGVTIFYSSHLLSDVESISHKVAMIVDGKIVREGTVDEITDSCGVEYHVRTREAIPQAELPEGVRSAGHPQECVCADDAARDRLLRYCLDKGIAVERMDHKRPSLEDILTEEIARADA